jgi:hypothetical protein
MSSIRDHLGTGFEVWASQQSWFWFVDKPHGNGAAIGAAATEGEAVRDACLTIEASLPRRHPSHPITITGWECSLANLDRYLVAACRLTA